MAGALGIGIGFGLQNIVNNFISGIILLFDPSIQVGDMVQIGEDWGTVSRINIRTTIVQTFDNASLIIPNSQVVGNNKVKWRKTQLRMGTYSEFPCPRNSSAFPSVKSGYVSPKQRFETLSEFQG